MDRVTAQLRACVETSSLSQLGDAAVMVWQETVNLPTSVIIGSIPIISTKFRSVRIEVITVDCLSIYGGSIPPQTAKFMWVCAEWLGIGLQIRTMQVQILSPTPC